MSARRSSTAPAATIGLLLGLLLVAALTAGPAMAHAGFVGSDPAEGATITAGAEQLSMTFTEDINPDLAVVTLTGSDGEQVGLPAPVVEGPEVVQPLPPLEPDALTLAYRVVSADGHPVQGTLALTAQGSDVSPAAATSPSPGPTAAPSTAEVENRAGVIADDGSGAAGWWVGAGVVGVLGVLAAVVLRSRRRG